MPRLLEQLRHATWPLRKRLGRVICWWKGECTYRYPGGAWCSWKAYACVHCKEWDRPLDSLPRVDFDEFEPWDEPSWRDR